MKKTTSEYKTLLEIFGSSLDEEPNVIENIMSKRSGLTPEQADKELKAIIDDIKFKLSRSKCSGRDNYEIALNDLEKARANIRIIIKLEELSDSNCI